MRENINTFLHKAPMLPITLAFIFGIVFGTYFASLWVLAIASICAAVTAIFKLYIQAAWIAAFGLGAFNISSVLPSENIKNLIDTELFYRARIVSVSENDNSQSAFIEILEVGIDSFKTYSIQNTKARITLPSFKSDLSEGYGLDFYATFAEPKSKVVLPDEFDYSNYLKSKNVYLTAIVTPDKLNSIYPLKDIISQSKRIRQELTRVLYQTNLNSGTKEFLNTTLLGDSSDLSDDTRRAFTASGLSHILALSGLHVGIIAAFIALAFWPIRALGYRRAVMVLTIFALWGYALISGFCPSVTRAVIMTTIYLMAQIIQRRSSPINSLMAAALIILIFSPEDLYSIGFQLSFAAVLSIILFVGKLNPVNRNNKILFTIASYIELSIAAMIGTALVSAYYFHTIPVYFLLGNLSVVIFLPLIIGGGLLVLISAILGCCPSFLCDIVSTLYSVMFYIANHISDLPIATIGGVYFSGWLIVGYGIVLTLLYLWLKKKNLKYGVAFGATIVALISVIIFAPSPIREAKVYISRESYRTNLIIDNLSDSLYIITTTPEEPIAVFERASALYGDYMGRRRIKGLKVVETDTLKRSGFIFEDNYLKFGSKNIAIISRKTPKIIRNNIDYLLVCRGFQGDILDIASQFDPDTIILSNDLHYKRAERYKLLCDSFKIPLINIRESSLAIRYSE